MPEVSLFEYGDFQVHLIKPARLSVVRQAPECRPELLQVLRLLLQSLCLEPPTSCPCRVHAPSWKPPLLPHHCRPGWSGSRRTDERSGQSSSTGRDGPTH